jgi:hypothetical protein
MGYLLGFKGFLHGILDNVALVLRYEGEDALSYNFFYFESRHHSVYIEDFALDIGFHDNVREILPDMPEIFIFFL